MNLSVRNLSFKYADTLVLKNLSFDLSSGKLISLIGKNGAGKSTLFKCILGILKNYTGSICLGDMNMSTIDAKQISKNVSYIPQSKNPVFNYTVLDMVLMGTKNKLSSIGIPKKSETQAAMQALSQLGIDSLYQRSYKSLSGGEQQLVMIARAMVQDVKVWILDEPVANLDYGNQLKIMQILKNLSKQGNMILMSTHSPEHAYTFSDEILALHNGEIVGMGHPKKIMDISLLKQMYDIDVEMYQIPGKQHCLFYPKM